MVNIADVLRDTKTGDFLDLTEEDDDCNVRQSHPK
jgi:hypothetical protein